MAQNICVLSLFLDVAFHTSAKRGIKLREIADLHRRITAAQFHVESSLVEVFRLMQMEKECVPGTCERNCFHRWASGDERSPFGARRLAFGAQGHRSGSRGLPAPRACS